MPNASFPPASVAANRRVIQRIGQEPLGYKIEQPVVANNADEQARLRNLAAVLGNTIETLRLRESMWKGQKEKMLAANLNTLSDAEKIQKIKDALFLADLPVPAINHLPSLLNQPDVVELLRTRPRLQLELRDLSGSQKMTAIQQHARTIDADVTGTRGLASRRFDPQTLLQDSVFASLIRQNNLRLNTTTGKITTSGGTVLVSLYRGDCAFALKTSADPTHGQPRAVYFKQGKAQGPRNEYIRDDKGVYTRRYAYVEKNKYQFRDLANRGLLAGRYSQDPGSRAPRGYNAIDPYARGQVPSLPLGAKFTDAYQLAYVHQELGSGFQQRGVSASSSPKYQIFSNQGEPFRTRDGVRLEIDLARVPLGTNTAPQLINHYAHGAKVKMGSVMDGFYVDKGTHTRQFDHYQWSVKKNRELFIKEVRPEHVSSLTLHETATGSSHTDSRPGGFTLGNVQSVGAHVGLLEYNRGFGDSIDGRANLSTSIARAELKKYYTEGYNDGQEYLRGYKAGVASGKPPDDTRDPAKVRFSQGFWDRHYKRGMRRF